MVLHVKFEFCFYRINEAIRISIGKQNTKSEVEQIASVLVNYYRRINKMVIIYDKVKE